MAQSRPPLARPVAGALTVSGDSAKSRGPQTLLFLGNDDQFLRNIGIQKGVQGISAEDGTANHHRFM